MIPSGRRRHARGRDRARTPALQGPSRRPGAGREWPLRRSIAVSTSSRTPPVSAHLSGRPPPARGGRRRPTETRYESRRRRPTTADARLPAGPRHASVDAHGALRSHPTTAAAAERGINFCMSAVHHLPCPCGSRPIPAPSPALFPVVFQLIKALHPILASFLQHEPRRF